MPCTCTVDLGERSYPIQIGAGMLESVGNGCKAAGLQGRALIVADSEVADLYASPIQEALSSSGLSVDTVVIPAGEASKNHTQLLRIYDAALAAGLERSSSIIALGGGVIGDLAGYAAATYLRGVRFVQLPTTLLAMVDSAVGGKTGVNLPQGKNLIGAFHQPALVVADIDCLATLPEREFAAGLAEVIKYGVIADPEILTVLEQHKCAELRGNPDVMEHLVRRSCEIKADVVRRDEREGGLRAILNFGHTLGHAIEQVGGYGERLHGEAISIGMVYAARLSERVRGFSPASTERLRQILEQVGLPTAYPDLPWEELMAAMQRDKKKQAGEVGFVLADELGSVQFGCIVPSDILRDVWERGSV